MVYTFTHGKTMFSRRVPQQVSSARLLYNPLQNSSLVAESSGISEKEALPRRQHLDAQIRKDSKRLSNAPIQEYAIKGNRGAENQISSIYWSRPSPAPRVLRLGASFRRLQTLIRGLGSFRLRPQANAISRPPRQFARIYAGQYGVGYALRELTPQSFIKLCKICRQAHGSKEPCR
jgi:hypothetical protein